MFESSVSEEGRTINYLINPYFKETEPSLEVPLQVALLQEGHQSVCARVCAFESFYESVWLAKKALVSPQTGLVHSGQRRVSWREQGTLDFR